MSTRVAHETQISLDAAEAALLASAQWAAEAAARHARAVAAGILKRRGIGRAELLRLAQFDEGVVLVVRMEEA